MRSKINLAIGGLALLLSIGARLAAQGPPAAPPAAPPGGAGQAGPTPAPAAGRGRAAGPGAQSFPAQQRQLAAPEVIARGRTLFEINCRACHGADLRGGDQGGPNLLRSQISLNDQHGELIGEVVKNGRQTPGMPVMPPLQLPDADVVAISEYIHSVQASARGQGAPPAGPPVVLNILVGDAKEGEAYFAAKCTPCHSTSGDMRGIASRIPDPMALQNAWVAGTAGGGRAGGTPTTVTVTTAAGEKVEGTLVRVDDFLVILNTANGRQRSFARQGDVPKVEIKDPREAHRKLLPTYTDKDMHDVTAYLVTLK